MRKYIIAITMLFSFLVMGQTQIKKTTIEERLNSLKQKEMMKQSSLVKNIHFNSIGPSVMGGRIVDIEADPKNSSRFYAAYASGGLWLTENNGITFTPLFDEQPTLIMGDIAVDWNNNEIIWVGTGENTSSRSSYSGMGIFKSTDKGKTFQYSGLGETQRIGRIVINPVNKDVVWVAASGALYSADANRGVYKTTDGGKSWRKTLFINDSTGVIDIAINPANPNELYAATWQRLRTANNFIGNGTSSAIFKSIDGGENWVKISGGDSGFPQNDKIGRIGLAVYPKDANIIYALVDNQNLKDNKVIAINEKGSKNQNKGNASTKEKLLEISAEEFLKLDDSYINEFLDSNNYPAKYNAAKIKEKIRKRQIKPADLVTFIENEEEDVNLPVIGAEVYRSVNAGKSWEKVNKSFINDFYYTYGYYFGNIRIDPENENNIYILGVNLLASSDGGSTFYSINEDNVHADHHALWIDPFNSNHIIDGNDGGVNITYDNGKNWFKVTQPAVGQFYSIAVDLEKPFNVYGGMQDNGVWWGPSDYTPNLNWIMEGKYPYNIAAGGDGMEVCVDTTNNNIIYAGSQYGSYMRIEKRSEKYRPIIPERNLGDMSLRFNWKTPIQLSSHNSNIFYYGANRLFRSMDKGDNYEAISHDLTRGKINGNVPFGTLTTFDESKFKFGLIYTGSDDGLVYITKDGGNNWDKIYDSPFWISKVLASMHEPATVYICLNGYRNDDFTPYILKSTNYGKSFERIGLNLPLEPVNCIREDPANSNILYVGTDGGLYVSLNKGYAFMPLYNGMPDVPVHDIAVQSEAHQLIAATHGRSLYKADVSILEQMDEQILQKPIHIFEFEDIYYSENWGKKISEWNLPYLPNLQIPVYSLNSGKMNLKIKTEDELIVYSAAVDFSAGINFINYNLSVDKSSLKDYQNYLNEKVKKKKEVSPNQFTSNDSGINFLKPGKYIVEISTVKNKESQSFEIKDNTKKKKKR